MLESFLTITILHQTTTTISQLKTCLTSIKKQTSKDYEWLVISNLSPKLLSPICYLCSNTSAINTQYLMFLNSNSYIKNPAFIDELKIHIQNTNKHIQHIRWKGDTWETSNCYQTKFFKHCVFSCVPDVFIDISISKKCELRKQTYESTAHILTLTESPISS